MLTAKEINSLPIGTYPNSYLRKKFGKKHGTPVPFQDKEGKIVTVISNRFWKRWRKKHPIRLSKRAVQNIETEFKQRYGNNHKVKKGWWQSLFSSVKDWFKGLLG